MKKTIFILLICVICIIISISLTYINYQDNIRQAEKENKQYEQYYNKVILGSDIATVINKAVDSNEKNEIQKDKEGLYIPNDTNSIKIDIKILGEDKPYPMERIYNLTIEEFMKHFNIAKFKCTDIKYHDTTKNVKYLLFEEVEN